MPDSILDLSYLENSAQCCGVYCIVNRTNGKKYIGSSKLIARRLTRHFSRLEGNRHENSYLQASWNKYGKESFEFRILEVVEPSLQFVREQFYLESEKPEYNLSGISIGFSGTVSEETRRKLSVAGKRYYENPENRRKQSEKMKGRRPSELSIELTRKRNRERVYTEEARKELRERHKGRILSAEHKQKISEAQKGRVHSEEARQKIAETLRGRPHSEERRRNNSEGCKGRRYSEETNRKRAASIALARTKRSPEFRSDAARRGWATRRLKGA